MLCGIYQIKNLVNNRVYIGQSVNVKKRFGQHISALRSGKERNTHLQRAFNKYGEQSFIFEVLMYCEQDQLTKNENGFIQAASSVYNVRPSADSNFGVKRTEETKALLSRVFKGRVMSLETRKRMSDSKKKEKNHNFGKPVPDIVKKKISDTLKRNGHPMTGKPRSDDVKRKISESNSGEKNGMFSKLWDATFCKRGHFLSKDNSYYYKKNGRTQRKCKKCHVAREEKRKTISILCPCGKTFYETPDKVALRNPRYCSKACQGQYLRGEEWQSTRQNNIQT